MSESDDSNPRWYRIPVVWVMAFVLIASVIGCLINVGVAWQHKDSSLQEVAPDTQFLLPARDNAQKP